MEESEIGRITDDTIDIHIRHYLMPRPFQKYVVYWEIIDGCRVDIFHVRHGSRRPLILDLEVC